MDDKIHLVPLELHEFTNIQRTIEQVRPDEIYNLASQSFVGLSFELPLFTADVTGLGPLRLLEAVRSVDPKIKFYQASSSEMFGKVQKPVTKRRDAILSSESLWRIEAFRALDGSRTTESHTACLCAPGSCLTTNLL